MEQSAALRLLAPLHARVIELDAAGLDRAELAERLGLDGSAIGPLLRVARTKLAALVAMPDDVAG